MIHKDLLNAALGNEDADTVFFNAKVFSPYTCRWKKTSFAVKNGIVLGEGNYTGKCETDLEGSKVLPGLSDAHVHIESSLLTPREYGRLVLKKGTTTVFADPHEIANVAGVKGIKYMISESRNTPLDIFHTAPSCVPATNLDMGGASVTSSDLLTFSESENIAGLGEMMNYPGVLSGDDEVYKKLRIFDVVDGHCPLLSGKELNAYIMQGISSDHECTSAKEAGEKLEKGMYIMLREGSTEKNLKDLVSVVTPYNVSKCMFATDDRHADTLIRDGHIDDCIRKAISCGLKPELAYRMATLSPAERFGLTDRGALSPGRIADFCIIDDSDEFSVLETYKSGRQVKDTGYKEPETIDYKFKVPENIPLDIPQKTMAKAHIAGIIKGQILTENILKEIKPDEIPDFRNDILKCVVCDRYRGIKSGLGLVHGFKMKKGAIASSVSHDSHNIISVGAFDEDILASVNLLKKSGGGMSVYVDEKGFILPLECGGIMSYKSYDEVNEDITKLKEILKSTGCIKNPFMYLSFLSLTVIPEIRITERGVFDVSGFRDIPLFQAE
ncbi:adenine deaminase [Methanomicrobium sp. W14]|uniref:adenine deaminase n=1 Tax=Methanomicrobium sp. W14 TaxID=2817839 RepID=UPI001AE3BC2D|nr:adenine deaminase [Methanomicrobium sp. W14]MBP2132293.1 adenine deaminase [Methanomicrobium sp. W14]